MSSTTIPQLAVLSDSNPRLMDRPAVDYFLMELVPIVRASAAVAQARTQKYEQEMIDAGLLPPAPPIKPTLAGGSKAEPPSAVSRSSAAMSLGMSGAGSAAGKDKVVDEEEEIVRKRLEAMGQHVGANLVERLCRDRPPFTDTLDAIKFVCKDLWSACWDKQVDNLRTNHRGVYVLQDNLFKPIARLSSWDGRADATRRARIYVAMPAGIIKGALGRLGLQATVTPEIQNLPQCTFQVKLR